MARTSFREAIICVNRCSKIYLSTGEKRLDALCAAVKAYASVKNKDQKLLVEESVRSTNNYEFMYHWTLCAIHGLRPRDVIENSEWAGHLASIDYNFDCEKADLIARFNPKCKSKTESETILRMISKGYLLPTESSLEKSKAKKFFKMDNMEKSWFLTRFLGGIASLKREHQRNKEGILLTEFTLVNHPLSGPCLLNRQSSSPIYIPYGDVVRAVNEASELVNNGFFKKTKAV